MTDDARPRISISLDRHWAYRFGWDWLTYRRLIRRAGGVAKTIFYHHSPLALDPINGIPTTYEQSDGLLLGGGIDIDPSHYRTGIDRSAPGEARQQRDQFELNLIRRALDQGRPILGICRGCQLLNVALGGTLKIIGPNQLHRHATRCWAHPVSVRRGSRLHAHVGVARIRSVRSLHREAIDLPGEGLRIVARAPDSTPEAIEHVANGRSANFCIGVQWHPELIISQSQDTPLIAAFVEASREFRRRRTIGDIAMADQANTPVKSRRPEPRS